MKTKASQQNKFVRIISIPFRALSKARDSYVKSITSYAERTNYVVERSRSLRASGLPKSFSVNAARLHESEDFRELVRAASARTIGNRVDLDIYINQQTNIIRRAMPPRSTSVAMGRIDEDGPCNYFGEDVNGNSNNNNNNNNNNNGMSLKNELNYKRSRSHAMTTRTTF